MKKSDIARRVAGRTGLGRSAAESAVDAVLEAVAEALAREETVRLAGFGTFSTRRRSARAGRNPRTGERVEIAASRSPSFKAGKRLRDAVKAGRTLPVAEQGHDGETGRPADGKAVARLDVSKWPGGVEPVWALLDAESVGTLGADPLEEGSAVRLADDLSGTELAGSAFVRNALVLLGEADGWGTLWTGTNGNLMVKDVARLRALMSWPGA